MKIEFFGVRGTAPLTSETSSVYGRNTTCLAVTSRGGDLLVLDGGTGLRALGQRLSGLGDLAPRRIHLFLTHFHFDHIQGLPFFAPLYAAGTEVSFYSAFSVHVLRRTLGRFMRPPFFPVKFSETASSKTMAKIGPGPTLVGGIAVKACPLRHPQSAFAFRLEEGDESFVLATDTEHPASGVDKRLARFAKGASTLVYDAMYTPEEYAAGRRGWGHSTWAAATALARTSGAGRLLLFHLNPDYGDPELESLENLARRDFPSAACAREGPLAEWKGRP